MRYIVQPARIGIGGSSEPIGEELCTYEGGSTPPVSIFDEYKWCGPHLASLTLFEYYILVRTKYVRDAIAGDIDNLQFKLIAYSTALLTSLE